MSGNKLKCLPYSLCHAIYTYVANGNVNTCGKNIILRSKEDVQEKDTHVTYYLYSWPHPVRVRAQNEHVQYKKTNKYFFYS